MRLSLEIALLTGLLLGSTTGCTVAVYSGASRPTAPLCADCAPSCSQPPPQQVASRPPPPPRAPTYYEVVVPTPRYESTGERTTARAGGRQPAHPTGRPAATPTSRRPANPGASRTAAGPAARQPANPASTPQSDSNPVATNNPSTPHLLSGTGNGSRARRARPPRLAGKLPKTPEDNSEVARDPNGDPI